MKSATDDDMKTTVLERMVRIFIMDLPIFERFIPLLIRLLPLFDRCLSLFVSYFLDRTMQGWKDEGLIESYKTRTVKTGRLHYKIEIYVVLTSEQLGFVLNDLTAKVLRRFKM